MHKYDEFMNWNSLNVVCASKQKQFNTSLALNLQVDSLIWLGFQSLFKGKSD